MTAQEQQIKTAYEVEDMSPMEIAECFAVDGVALDVVSVKSCLINYSSKYRQACEMAPENDDSLNFSKDEQQRIKDAIFDLAMGAESEKLRFEALIYCRDDAKGRKDIGRNLPTTNVLVLNNILKQGRQIAEKIKTIN